MKKTVMVSVLIISITLMAGCSKSCGADREAAADQVPPEARELLTELGIDPGDLTKKGGDLSITYEASNADQYDDQIVVEWATIFGALGFFAEDSVTIINTAGGVPMASIRARTEDIDLLLSAEIEVEQFLQKLEIKALDAAPGQG